MPMMNILFKQDVIVPTLPAKFEFSGHYFKAWFQVNFLQILEKNGYVTTLLYVCVGIVVFVFLANLFKYMERMVASRVKVDVVRNIRVDIFKHVSLLHIGYFNDQRKGDLISRFTNDVSEMENTVVNGFKAIREPITLMIFIFLLFSISVKLSLFTLIILPLAGGVIASIIKRLKQRAVQSQEAMGRIVNILDEAFSGMRVINAFNARNFLMRKIENETTFHRKVNLSISRRNELSSPLSEFLGIVAVAAILFYGG